jgi:hypothetical protein
VRVTPTAPGLVVDAHPASSNAAALHNTVVTSLNFFIIGSKRRKDFPS